MADKIRQLNGKTVAFPDSMSDAEIQRVMDEQTPSSLDYNPEGNSILNAIKGPLRSIKNAVSTPFKAYADTHYGPESPDAIADLPLLERVKVSLMNSEPVREVRTVGKILGSQYDATQEFQRRAENANAQGNRGEEFFHHVNAALPLVGSVAEKVFDSAQKGDNVGGTLEGLTDLALMKGGSEADEVAPKVMKTAGETLKDLGETSYNSALKVKGKHEAFGARPGRGVAQEKIVAATKRSLLDKVEGKIPERSQQAQEILDLPQNAAKRVNILDAVSRPFDETIQAGEEGVMPDATLDRLEQTRNELTQVRGRDAEGNRIFTGPKPLDDVSPAEANKMKQGIYERTNYRNPELDEAVNTNLRRSARNTKDAVNEAVPDVVPVNQRVQDLSSARDALGGHLKNKLVAPNAIGVKDIAPMAIGASVGHPLFGLGAADVLGSTMFKTGLGRALYGAGDFLSPDEALPTPTPRFTQPQLPATTVFQMGPSGSSPMPEPEILPPGRGGPQAGEFGGRPAGPGVGVGEKFDARGSGVRGELPAGPESPLMLPAPPRELGLPGSPEPPMRMPRAKRVVVRDPATGRMKVMFLSGTDEPAPFEPTAPPATLLQKVDQANPPRRR
jgi:hypothetical protein